MNRFKIAYEDEALLIVDKPPGMLVIPTPSGEENTLTGLLNREFKARGETMNVHPCHRLDRETSGLVIYSKGKRVQRLMMEKFRRREVKKNYIAFVHGRPLYGKGVIDRPIENKRAVTRYKVLESRRDFSIVAIEPVTGRTNQIRIHFKMLGHPLVGERRFAFAKDYVLKFRRAALHSRGLEFRHPLNNALVKVAAPLAEDMEEFLQKQRRQA